jgi:hypothetical protein
MMHKRHDDGPRHGSQWASSQPLKWRSCSGCVQIDEEKMVNSAKATSGTVEQTAVHGQWFRRQSATPPKSGADRAGLS